MRPGNVGTPTPLTILQAAIEGGVTAESVGVVERPATVPEDVGVWIVTNGKLSQ